MIRVTKHEIEIVQEELIDRGVYNNINEIEEDIFKWVISFDNRHKISRAHYYNCINSLLFYNSFEVVMNKDQLLSYATFKTNKLIKNNGGNKFEY